MKIKDKISHLKYRIKNKWHYAVKVESDKLKNKGYSFKKCVDDYMRLSLICTCLIIVILLLIILLVLSFIIW